MYTLMLTSYLPHHLTLHQSMSAATLLYHVKCHGTHSDSTIAFVLQFDLGYCYYL
jgi:hypothetical protein